MYGIAYPLSPEDPSPGHVPWPHSECSRQRLLHHHNNSVRLPHDFNRASTHITYHAIVLSFALECIHMRYASLDKQPPTKQSP